MTKKIKFGEIKAGDWDKLWVMMKAQSWGLPCFRHRLAMRKFDTAREYLRSLPVGYGEISAYSARIYFAYVTHVGGQLVSSSEFRSQHYRQFTEPEIERVMAALRRSLDGE